MLPATCKTFLRVFTPRQAPGPPVGLVPMAGKPFTFLAVGAPPGGGAASDVARDETPAVVDVPRGQGDAVRRPRHPRRAAVRPFSPLRETSAVRPRPPPHAGLAAVHVEGPAQDGVAPDTMALVDVDPPVARRTLGLRRPMPAQRLGTGPWRLGPDTLPLRAALVPAVLVTSARVRVPGQPAPVRHL